MRAAAFDRYVRIESPVRTLDPEYGTETLSWIPVSDAWAEVQDVLPSKAESIASGIDVSRRPARVRMRYRTDVTNMMRIIDLSRDNRILEIMTHPAEMGRREGIEFMVQEFSIRGDA